MRRHGVNQIKGSADRLVSEILGTLGIELTKEKRLTADEMEEGSCIERNRKGIMVKRYGNNCRSVWIHPINICQDLNPGNHEKPLAVSS
jgi:hypothetical protein